MPAARAIKAKETLRCSPSDETQPASGPFIPKMSDEVVCVNSVSACVVSPGVRRLGTRSMTRGGAIVGDDFIPAVSDSSPYPTRSRAQKRGTLG